MPRSSPLLLATGLALALSGCGGGSAERDGLILAQSLFEEDGRVAEMVLVRPPETEGGEWTEEVIRESLEWEYHPEYAEPPAEGEKDRRKQVFAGGDVFHKAMWYEPPEGEPGILSITANRPFLKIWRERGDVWEDEVLWTAPVSGEGAIGGKENRLRDVEAADVDGDGVEELVVVTHDRGVVLVFQHTGDGKYEPSEIDRTEESIVIHEVETGDVNGDGTIEIFTTPSEPNKLDGSHQLGWIHMYRWNGSEFEETVVDTLDTRHAKEILCADVDGDGTPRLFAALEAEGAGGGDGASTSAVKMYTWNGEGFDGEVIADLPGQLCRFLNVGDTDGDGVTEILASTKDDGIFSIRPEGEGWSSRNVVAGYRSGGFEHATIVFDWDGDGYDDLFVASDNEKRLQRFHYDPETGRYALEKLADWSGKSYITWNVMPLPAGR